ncbi:hypothetical protein C0J52_03118 [Blattella germanica]|nr:hypothetical protein C0J52_03118 [Blattella germanica]
MACVQEKAQCMEWFIETRLDIQVQRKLRTRYGRQPPSRPSIRKWYNNFMQAGGVDVKHHTGKPRTRVGYPNVLILTTSNVTSAIDLAFVDRADIKQYIGPPSTCAIYKIYQSCIQELKRAGIIVSIDNIVPVKLLQLPPSEGLSGRTLRKIPFLAHAYYVQTPHVSLEDFIQAMQKAVSKQISDRQEFGGLE